MFIHPSIHVEIARERQRDLLARSERRRTVKAALAGRDDDRGRLQLVLAVPQEPSATTSACRPHRVNA
jgi:hypothetical protein